MKFNCDMGESFGPWSMGNDEAVMPHIDLANIACGFHASDPVTMAKTVALAVQHHVSIGAHPGYPDLLGFGRRNMQLSGDELYWSLLYQLGALEQICQAHGTEVSYVKPHGALYNQMAQDPQMLATVLQAVAAFKPNCPLMMIAGVCDEQARELAQQQGVPLLFEAFCDRAYNDDGTLVSRQHPQAVHSRVEQVIAQARQISQQRTVTTLSGKIRPLVADSICLHGDNHHLLAAVAQLRATLS